jgi:oligopeptide transport system substrate-binding protein
MFRLTRANRGMTMIGLVTALVMALSWSVTSASSLQRSSAASAHLPSGVLISQQETGDADWVQTLDPAIVTDSVSISNIWMVDANLVKLSWPTLKPIGDLADSWRVSPNRRVWTFHIRNNARFSNGDKVNAFDVRWSISRALKPATKSPVALMYLGEIAGADAVAKGKAPLISGVKAVNSQTVRITLKDPIAYFLGTLAYPTADVLDPRVMAGKQPGSYLTNTCKGNVGAGPFVFVCQNRSSSRTSFYPSGHSPYMLFKANPFYYGKKPHITVRAPFIADNETNWRLYQAGQIDETVVPTADLSQAQKLPGFVKHPALETDYISLNQKDPPFNDLNCRLAVAYAIDRAGITEKLLHGVEYPLYDVIPKGMPGGGQGYFGLENDVPHFDPTKAKAYLAKCPGHLDGVNLYYQNTGQDVVHEYDAIRANLQGIGANINTKPLTFNAWLTKVTTPMTQTKTAMAENLWIDDYPDAQDWLQNLLFSNANDNIGGFANPTFDSLVHQGNITANPVRRAALYRRAMKIAVNQVGWLGVGGVYTIYVVRQRLHGVVVSSGLVLPKNNDWSNVSVG